MKIRTTASVMLIIFTIGLCFWLFVKPVIMPPEKKARFVEEQQLYYVGDSEEGERTYMYADIKEEVKEWSKILANFAPILTVLGAWLLSRKKK